MNGLANPWILNTHRWGGLKIGLFNGWLWHWRSSGPWLCCSYFALTMDSAGTFFPDYTASHRMRQQSVQLCRAFTIVYDVTDIIFFCWYLSSNFDAARPFESRQRCRLQQGKEWLKVALHKGSTLSCYSNVQTLSCYSNVQTLPDLKQYVTFQQVRLKSNFAQSKWITHMVITYVCTNESTFNPNPQQTGN